MPRDNRLFDTQEIYGIEDMSSTRHFAKTRQDVRLIRCPTCRSTYSCSCHDDHYAAIVLAVDGACRNNGRRNATAAIGVYFRSRSRHNISRTLKFTSERAINSKAELAAVLFALRAALEKGMPSGLHRGVNKLVVRSDSSYVVNGITSWALAWETHDWCISTGAPVANQIMWREVIDVVTSLECRGVDVKFWKVDRTDNRQADKLANNALNV